MFLAFFSIALARPLADCPQAWPAAALGDVVASADLAMGKMDARGFLDARDLLLGRLECVAEPLSGTTVASVHRVMATAAFLQKEEARIAPALAGLLAANPGYQMPPALYPEGHPVRALLPHAALLVRDTGTRALIPLPSGWLEVDGMAAPAVPAARAAIVQQLDGQGAVVETRYVWPQDALGTWAPVDPPVATGLPPLGAGGRGPPATPPRTGGALRPRERSPARVPLLVATAASLAATGVLYGVARDRYDTFWDTSTPAEPAALEALAAETNALTVGWIAAGAASVGLGVGLAFAW